MSQNESPVAGSERLPTSKRRERSRRAIQLLVLSFAAIMMVDAVVGEQGVVALERARQEFEQLTEQVRRIRADNEAMREQNRRLRDDRSALEEAARRELGLMKPGEKVFIIKDLPSPAAP